MVRSVAARAKLALAFWMLLAFCGLARCEASLEGRGTGALFALETGSSADTGGGTQGLKRDGAALPVGNAGAVSYGSGNRVVAFGVRPLV